MGIKVCSGRIDLVGEYLLTNSREAAPKRVSTYREVYETNKRL